MSKEDVGGGVGRKLNIASWFGQCQWHYCLANLNAAASTAVTLLAICEKDASSGSLHRNLPSDEGSASGSKAVSLITCGCAHQIYLYIARRPATRRQ
jgi:hypothetical protein